MARWNCYGLARVVLIMAGLTQVRATEYAGKQPPQGEDLVIQQYSPNTFPAKLLGKSWSRYSSYSWRWELYVIVESRSWRKAGMGVATRDSRRHHTTHITRGCRIARICSSSHSIWWREARGFGPAFLWCLSARGIGTVVIYGYGVLRRWMDGKIRFGGLSLGWCRQRRKFGKQSLRLQ